MRSFFLLSLLLPLASAFAPTKHGSVVTKPSNAVRPTSSSLMAIDPVHAWEASSSLLALGPSEAWDAYNEALNNDPLPVKSVTAGVILGLADLVGQALQNGQRGEDEKEDLDIARVARFAIFGFVLQAPWNHFYYLLLDGTIPPTPEPWTPTTAVKTVIDQFVQAPVFTILIFGFLGALEGKNLESIKQQLDDDYKDTMIANCKKTMLRFCQ